MPGGVAGALPALQARATVVLPEREPVLRVRLRFGPESHVH